MIHQSSECAPAVAAALGDAVSDNSDLCPSEGQGKGVLLNRGLAEHTADSSELLCGSGEQGHLKQGERSASSSKGT